MADADRILRLLLQVQADTSDLGKVQTGVAAIADETTQQAALESQLATIAQTRLDLIGAQLSGETSISAQLQQELSVRTAILGAMRAQTLTAGDLAALGATEEGLLAKTAVAAEGAAAGGLLASVNFAKARNEAVILGRELATGNVRASTMGALLGSFGPLITVAAVAGYGLYQAVAHAYDGVVEMNKEVAKQAGEVSDAIGNWLRLADETSNFADTVKLGDKIAADLKRAAGEYATWRATELTLWQKFIDEIVKMWAAIPGFGNTPNATALAAGTASSKNNLVLEIQAQAEAIARSNKALADWNAEQKNVAAGIPELQAKIGGLTQAISAQQAIIDNAAKKGPNATDQELISANAAVQERTRLNDLLQVEQGHLDQLNQKWDRYQQISEKIANDEKVRKAELTGDPEQIADAKAAAARQQILRELGDEKGVRQENVALADREAQLVHDATLRQLEHKDAVAATKLEHQQIEALLEKENQDLAQMRAELAAIKDNPFLTYDQKAAAEIASIPQQITKLNQEIQQNKTIMQKSALDPQVWQRAQGNINKAAQDIGQLQIQLKLLQSPTAQFEAGLVSWVNSFGSITHQLSGLLTNTLGTAISGISNAITGLIFKTETWGQAFSQIAQQIVNDVINVVLQIAVQQGVLAALHAVFGETLAASTEAVSAQSAASWAPAATAASIATYGGADVAGIAGLASAMAAGVTIVTGAGAFAQGGVIPGPPSSRDNRLAMVASGEGILTAATVARFGGPSFVDSLNRGFSLHAPSGFSSGGVVGTSSGSRSVPRTGFGGSASLAAPAAPAIRQALFFDKREAVKWLLDDPQGQAELFDLINNNTHLIRKR
ncbi:MAG TPA: hypothetical protein VGG02_00565 [Chthoniobacterales bacterium]|jgi:hypothetical protein